MSEMSVFEFADKLHEIMPVIIKEFVRRQEKELYKGKITITQFLILDFLHRRKESKMKTLADFMGVSTAAMTGMVDRLIRHAYVTRKFDPRDRRIIKIQLNSKGSELVEKISQKRRQMIVKIFGKISSQERADYLRILQRIYEVLTGKTEAQPK